MRHGVSVWLVLAGLLLASLAAAQEQSQPESLPGEELPGQPGFSEDWPRERPMLYYEGFGVMDFNRDGAIEKEEYDRAFRRMDSDGDGSIDTREWKAVHGPEDENES